MRAISQPVLASIATSTEGCAALDELCDGLGLTSRSVVSAVQVLKRRDLVEIVGRGTYRITPAGIAWLGSGRAVACGQGARLRLSSGLRERAWWLMRELRKFTLADLLTTLADGSERDAAGNLSRYLRGLECAGVITRMQRKVPGTSPHSNGHTLWWLKRDLGRIPPVWRAPLRQVFDPNSNTVLEARHD